MASGSLVRFGAHTGSVTTAVVVGRHALAALAEEIGGRRFVLIVDRRVQRLHGARLRAAFVSAPLGVLSVPSGESAKCLEVAAGLWARLAVHGLRRDDVVVVAGGGATLDAGGFVASTWMRGVPWIAVPTTLLAQVDACIGGKTALDLEAGKNLVGTFHPPVAAIADPSFLETVPERAYRAALFEVLKLGWLKEPALTALALSPALARRAATAVGECVGACLAKKASLVAQDPGDRGVRRLLNLGHTFGHAIEAAAGFRVLHGEAVGIGLLAAAHAAHALGHIGARAMDARRAEVLGLGPPPLPASLLGRALGAARLDKKAVESSRMVLVLPARGGARIVSATASVFRDALASACSDLGGRRHRT